MQRLKTRSQFQAVLAGRIEARTAHFALHCTRVDQILRQQEAATSQVVLFGMPDVWLGAMVPKRWAKQAVTRNTIKRQIYSVSSEFASTFAIAAYVVRLRATFDRQQFISATSDVLKAAIRQELWQLFERARVSRAAPVQPGCAA